MKYVKLPKLNNLKPTVLSTCFKLMEEIGEYSQLVGKFSSMSGEKNIKITEEEKINRICNELIDIAQVAVTMIFVLMEEYKIDNIANKKFLKIEIKEEIDCTYEEICINLMKSIGFLSNQVDIFLILQKKNIKDEGVIKRIIKEFYEIAEIALTSVYSIKNDEIDTLIENHINKMRIKKYMD